MNDTIDSRLQNIECLLLDLEQTSTSEKETSTKDIGGVEVATSETGLSTHSIYRLVCQRKIPHSKKGGRLYFSSRALMKWISEGERKGAAA